MGLNIHLGGVGADAGMAAGAGFAKGVPQGLEDGKAQAAANEMIEATKSIYAAELERVDNLTPDLDAGKPTMVQSSLPMGLGSVEMPKFLNPTKNKSQEHLDGLAAKYAEKMQGFTNPEAAKLYTQGSVASLDEAHSGMIRENLTSSMSAAAESGAMTTEQLAPFLEGLAAGEDPREVYKEYRSFVSGQIESRRDAARIARHVGRMRTATAGFMTLAKEDSENAAWYEHQAMEMDDLAVEAEESAKYGNESLDSEALWEKYKEIKHRRTPAQDSIANQERIDDWVDTRANMLKLNEDADTTVIDAKISEALGVSVHGSGFAGTDEAGNTFGAETTFPEQGVGAGVVAPGGEVHAGGAPGAAPQAVTGETASAESPAKEGSAEYKQDGDLARIAAEISPSPERGRKGKMGSAMSVKAVDDLVGEALVVAGVDLSGDVAAQVEQLSPYRRSVLRGVLDDAKERAAFLEEAPKEIERRALAEHAATLGKPNRFAQWPY